MAQKRFKPKGKWLLRDRSGKQFDVAPFFGSVTLDLSAISEGLGVVVDVVEEQLTTEPLVVSEESTTPSPSLIVFRHWALVTDRDVTTEPFTPSRERTIEKALKEASAEECCRALDGLMAWRMHKPGDTQLSAVFQTRPNGRPLREQIEFFMDQVGETAHGLSISSEDQVKINRAKDWIRSMQGGSESAQVKEQADRAERYLRDMGWSWETVDGPRGPMVQFIAPA